jgi:oxaloacetate decarboxylase alpha subunit
MIEINHINGLDTNNNNYNLENDFKNGDINKRQNKQSEVEHNKKIKITDTTLRDAHQSLLATRLSTKDMVPICDKLDQVGYYSMEVWGGATFDSCLRYLDEDPWERLRILRKRLPNTKLQMLLRGQNILGYKHYPDDVLTEFIKRAVGNGIDIIRIFDALNDLRNMEKSFEITKIEGAHVQGTICYTLSPFHSNEIFVKKAKNMELMGADSICIKDMAGLISPYDAYDLISKIKKSILIPVQLHCHSTAGLGSLAYLKAIEANVDVIDTAISSLSLQTSQPPVEPFVALLKGKERDPGFDLILLSEIADYFKKIREKYKDMESSVDNIGTRVLAYQLPGGMLSNLSFQLRQQKIENKYEEILKEIPEVRKDLGYPPLVTPTSQIVGSQAVFNVIAGKRYQIISEETKKYLKGFYGRPPAPISKEIYSKAGIPLKDVIKVRPADMIEPLIEQTRKEKKYLLENIEDALSYILFPSIAEDFLKKKVAKKNFFGIEIFSGKHDYDQHGYPI